jgi:hypothetical protein
MLVRHFRSRPRRITHVEAATPGSGLHRPIEFHCDAVVAKRRLMRPSDLGELLRPFAFLDVFEADLSVLNTAPLHPHSGIGASPSSRR